MRSVARARAVPQRGRVADGRFGGAVERQRPGGDGAGVTDGDEGLGNIERFADEIPDVACGNP